MQKLAASRRDCPRPTACELDFALGKAYADLKDHRRSFQHLLAANAGKRATISYDETGGPMRSSTRIERTFTRELIAAKSGRR